MISIVSTITKLYQKLYCNILMNILQYWSDRRRRTHLFLDFYAIFTFVSARSRRRDSARPRDAAA